MEARVALGVGVVGYGLAGRSFHAPLIATVRGLELRAVVTTNPARAAQARAEHPGVRVFAAAEELLSIGGVDVVVIATPNRTHVPLAAAAIDAGLAVVVDKPLAPTVAAARALIARASARGVLLTVYHNRRWDGDFLTVKQLVSEGALGEVLRFESRFERWRPQAKEGWRRSGDPADAGGLLYDLGTHLIDQALQLFGPVVQVYAEPLRRRSGAAVDEDTFVALEHGSGVRSHLWMNELAARTGPRFRVLGTRAGYVKYGMDVQEAKLRAGMRPGPDWGREAESAWGTLGAEESTARVPTQAGAYASFYERLVPAVRLGAPPPVEPHDAVAVLEVIEAAQRWIPAASKPERSEST